MCSSCSNWKSEPVVIGHKNPDHYQSIYGYPKDRLPVYRVSDSEQASPIGFIKEEILRGPDGAETGRMYYERNGWRQNGQPRFFDSPEALVAAFGGTVARKVGLKKTRAKVAPKATRKPARKSKAAA